MTRTHDQLHFSVSWLKCEAPKKLFNVIPQATENSCNLDLPIVLAANKKGGKFNS